MESLNTNSAPRKQDTQAILTSILVKSKALGAGLILDCGKVYESWPGFVPPNSNLIWKGIKNTFQALESQKLPCQLLEWRFENFLVLAYLDAFRISGLVLNRQDTTCLLYTSPSPRD